MEDLPPAQPLSLASGHAKGFTSISWHTQDGRTTLITAGQDGLVARRANKEGHATVSEREAQQADGEEAGCHAIAVSDSLIATADGCNVSLFMADSLEHDRFACRFQLPARCLAFSRNGATLVAGGDDGNVRILDVQTTKAKLVKAEGFVRGLALDPEGAFLAAATADGSVSIWEAREAWKQVYRKRIAPKVDQDSAARLCLAWHPEGTCLALPSTDNDVVLLERHDWRNASGGAVYLSGAHTAPVEHLAFSPNGMYMATSAGDGLVAVWRVADQRSRVVALARLEQAATSLAWRPDANELAVASAGGGVGVWRGFLPEGEPSCWKRYGDAPARQAAGGASAGTAGGDDSMALAAVDGDAGGGGKRRRLRLASWDELPDGVQLGGGSGTDGEEEAGGAHGGRGQREVVVREVLVPAAPDLPKPQAPIMPGGTPWEQRGGCRFLAYTRTGAIISRRVEGHHTVEVAFHNVAGRRRVPLLTDYFGFDLGALGPGGALYASPASADSPAAMVVYRPFEAWAPNSDWAAALPAGEAALCLAAGASFAAAATSAGLLRVWSAGGLARGVVGLRGAPVAMAAWEHQLALVWHAGNPGWQSGAQALEFAVWDVRRQAQLDGGPLRLAGDASLTWLGFSPEGVLAAYDSAGRLQLRGREWGGAWLPAFDAAAAASASGEGFWPVGLALQPEPRLLAVATPPGQPHPLVHPAPVLTQLPLAPPVAAAEGGAADLEGDALTRQLLVGQLRWQAEQAASDPEGAAEGEAAGPEAAAELAAAADALALVGDRALLRLVQAALKAERPARALEVAATLAGDRSVEGALRLASHHRQGALAERISALLQRRMDWAAAADAAAAAEEAGEHQAALAAAAQRHRAAAAGAHGRGGLAGEGGSQWGGREEADEQGGGDDGGMAVEAQASYMVAPGAGREVSPAGGADLTSQPDQGEGEERGTTSKQGVAPMFGGGGGRHTAGSNSSARAAAASSKCKAQDAGLLGANPFARKASAGGGGNPFARK